METRRHAVKIALKVQEVAHSVGETIALLQRAYEHAVRAHKTALLGPSTGDRLTKLSAVCAKLARKLGQAQKQRCDLEKLYWAEQARAQKDFHAPSDTQKKLLAEARQGAEHGTGGSLYDYMERQLNGQSSASGWEPIYERDELEIQTIIQDFDKACPS